MKGTVRGQIRLLGLLAAALFIGLVTPVNANEEQEILVRNGLKMFRTILTADQDIEHKHNEDNGIDIIFIYTDNLSRAQHLARKFVLMGRGATKGKIKDRPISVHITTSLTQIRQQQLRPAGLFILDKVDNDTLLDAVQYGLEHKIVTYSPFKGDVEKGVLGGIVIGTRPRPFINNITLQNSDLKIKSFFLKVAELYEP
ncbi:MAG: hypothetical protein ACFHVJ_12545 [Aestuariibacter sp.]